MAIDALARGMAAAAGGGGGGLDVGIDAGTGIRFTGTDPITIINTGVTAVTTPGDNDIAEDGTIKVANPGAENSADRVHYVKVKGINKAAFKDVDTVINDTKAASTNVPTTKAVYDELVKKLEADLDTTAFTNDNDHVPSSKLVKEKLDDKLEDSLTINGVSYDSTNDSYTLDGDDVDLTGYTAISSGTEEDVAATDSVNDAIAKVEYKADNRIPTDNIDADFPVTPDVTHVLASTVASATFQGTGTAGVSPKKGLVPAPSTTSGTETRYLKADGTWDTPPNTEYSEGTGIDINNAGVITNTGVTDVSPSDIADPSIANGTFKVVQNGTEKYIPIKGLDDAAYKDVDGAITSGSTSTNLPTTQAVADFVDTTIANLEKPVIFKGTVGTGGTVTSLPTAQASTRGYEYQAITTGTIPAAQSASGSQETYKIGDMLICALTSGEGVTPQTFGWVVNPSGNEPEGTVTSLTAEKGIVAYSTDPQTAGAGTIATQGKFYLNLKNDTQLQNPAVTGTDSADRLYPLALDSNGKLATNVPWTDTTYEFADGYNASTNKGATVATVTNAINALDVSAVTVGATKTLTSISQTDGKISATATDIQSATTSQKGLVQLNDAIDNTSTAQAATANAVKKVNDKVTTNQANIWYATNKVGKNELKLTGNVSNPNTIRVYWNYEEGTVRITGTSATTSTVFILLGSWTAKKTGEYILASEGANSSDIYVYDDGSWNTNGSPIATWTAGTTRSLYVRIRSGVVVGDVTVKPMVCLKSLYDADSSVDTYALPNSDLTLLEAEDRAALAEEIDAGAKNLLLRTNNEPTTHDNVTFTPNSDGSVTINSTGAITDNRFATFFSGKMSDLIKTSGYYTLYANAGSGNSRVDVWWYYTDDWTQICQTTSNISRYIETSNRPIIVRVRALAGEAISNAKLYPMLCTNAAFGVSNKFVPYRPSWDVIADSIKTVQIATSDFITVNTNFTILSQSTLFKHGSQVFGTLVIQKTDEAKFVDSLAAVGTIKSGYRPIVNLIGQSYYNTEQWGVNGFGYSYINTSGTVSVKTSTDSASKYSYVAVPINYMTA